MVSSRRIFMKLKITDLHHMSIFYIKLYSNLSRKIKNNGQNLIDATLK